MLRLELHKMPQDFSQLPSFAEREVPAFARYTPDYGRLYTLAGQYASIENFIVIGRGGSISAFRAIYYALARFKTTKHVYLLDTLDPGYTAFLKQRCRAQDTLVIVVSKSGNTVEVLENLLCFQEYRKIVVTGGGALEQLAKIRELELVHHPPIGGRFSGGTESALLPAALIYVDVKSIAEGMRAMFAQCSPQQPIEQNPALRLAASLFLAEQQGATEVYAPVYSKALAGSLELWTQLMHESACKERRGQTFLFLEAPECQHHTNQKFFDGPRRMAGLFTHIKQQEPFTIPAAHQFADVKVGDLPLNALMERPLGSAMEAEFTGLCRAADEQAIPYATVTLDALTPGSFGELTAFWMYVAVYSAWLRGVDAFDQPGVEASKRYAREARVTPQD